MTWQIATGMADHRPIAIQLSVQRMASLSRNGVRPLRGRNPRQPRTSVCQQITVEIAQPASRVGRHWATLRSSADCFFVSFIAADLENDFPPRGFESQRQQYDSGCEHSLAPLLLLKWYRVGSNRQADAGDLVALCAGSGRPWQDRFVVRLDTLQLLLLTLAAALPGPENDAPQEPSAPTTAVVS
jgi:hypothetical protein